MNLTETLTILEFIHQITDCLSETNRFYRKSLKYLFSKIELINNGLIDLIIKVETITYF